MLFANTIISLLEQAVLEELADLEVLPTVDSTNSYLLAQGKIHPKDVRVCLAEMQTAARGRRSKSWQAPEGSSLSLSISYPFTCPMAKLAGLSLAVGVVLGKLMRQLGLANTLLKWPNDLLINEQKFTGILVEMQQSCKLNGEGYECLAVIGIGINLANSKLITLHQQQAITSLAEQGLTIEREQLAAAILNKLLPALAIFQKSGLAPFMADWWQLDALAGQQLIIKHGQNTLTGAYAGITENGDILLKVGERRLQFSSGEVSVRKLSTM